PVVVAGNAAVAAEVCGRLASGGKEARRAENVMPRSGELSVESAREEIRKLFMERITEAKGLEKIRELVHVVLPTPMAVLEGVRLAAQGRETVEGWGDMLVVDVGGATTDVHSIGYGHPAGENVVSQGLAEPFAKRTVEGDLGIRFNAATIMNRVGLDRLEEEFCAGFPELPVTADQIAGYVDGISRQTETVPQEHWHSAADAILARAAVELAVERHVGKRERVFAREGETWIHYGKDMRETRTVIGTGGVFIYNPHVAHILSRTPAANGSFEVLRPKNPQCFVDSSYLLYAVGLLAEAHPQVAVRIFQDHMKPVGDKNP
ncbi:MAG: glutamate mutase L, partial [Candidatus Binatia bacterium]